MFDFFRFFPKNIAEILSKSVTTKLEEIRIRANKPIILKSSGEYILEYIVTPEEVINILQRICENSIYSYQNQICSRVYNNKRWT